MLKLNVKGSYGEANFGDDLLMCVFENYFLKEFNNIELNFVGIKNDYSHKLLTNSTYLKPNFLPDWEIYGGGTQFFAFQSKQETSLLQKFQILFKNPEILKNKFNSFFLKSSPHNIKTAFLGFGIGPFHENEGAIINARKKIEQAHFVGVRDAVSHQYCLDWEIASVLGADVVFSSYFVQPEIEKTVRNNSKKRIGIIVRDWEWEESGKGYINELMEFYKSYSDAVLQFIVFSPLKDKHWIAKLKHENVLIWNPHKYSIKSFLSELNVFDAFISARYHGAIIASLLNKPVICVEIEPKLKILTEQIESLKLWEKPFNVHQLIEHVKHLDYDIHYEKSLLNRRIKADLMLKEFKNAYDKDHNNLTNYFVKV